MRSLTWRRLWLFLPAIPIALHAPSTRADAESAPTTQGTPPAPVTGAPQPATGAARSPAATPDLAEEERAKALYQKAQEKYQDGDLLGALGLLEKAYEVSHRPAFLFNLGQLNRELLRCRPALQNYRLYLELEPNAHRQADAEAAISQLSRECPDPPVVMTDVASPPPPPPSYWTPPHVVAWSAIGGGAVAAGAALYFGLSARSAANDVEAISSTIANQQPASARSSWDSTGEARQAEGERAEKLAIGFGVGAAALIAGGVITLALTPSRSPESAPAVSWVVRPGAVRAAYGVRF